MYEFKQRLKKVISFSDKQNKWKTIWWHRCLVWRRMITDEGHQFLRCVYLLNFSSNSLWFPSIWPQSAPSNPVVKSQRPCPHTHFRWIWSHKNLSVVCKCRSSFCCANLTKIKFYVIISINKLFRCVLTSETPPATASVSHTNKWEAVVVVIVVVVVVS